jgi:hypothetical protein
MRSTANVAAALFGLGCVVVVVVVIVSCEWARVGARGERGKRGERGGGAAAGGDGVLAGWARTLVLKVVVFLCTGKNTSTF